MLQFSQTCPIFTNLFQPVSGQRCYLKDLCFDIYTMRWFWFNVIHPESQIYFKEITSTLRGLRQTKCAKSFISVLIASNFKLIKSNFTKRAHPPVYKSWYICLIPRKALLKIQGLTYAGIKIDATFPFSFTNELAPKTSRF